MHKLKGDLSTLKIVVRLLSNSFYLAVAGGSVYVFVHVYATKMPASDKICI